MSVLTFDVGLAHKLKQAFARANWKEEDINLLASLTSDRLTEIRSVLRGHASINVVEHVIDCDADPFIPFKKDGWTVEEHKKGGSFKWDASRVELYLSDDQKKGGGVRANELRKELEKKFTLNANVLDYLLKNPRLIPEEWKRDGLLQIIFWGTIYRNREGSLFVRHLYWSERKWDWHTEWLNVGHISNDKPAAILAA